MTASDVSPSTTDAERTVAVQAVETVDRIKEGFLEGTTRHLEWRTEQLDAMEAMLRENADAFVAALEADLGKAATEAWTTEIGFTLSDIDHQRRNLSKWTKPRKVRLPIAFQPGSARIVPEPKGTVLIIAPWNYPVQLLLAPMAAAIGAGNAIVAKPSELAPATSALLAEMCTRYLDTSTIAVIEGGVDTSTALLEQPFDHIFFTGGTRVGKIVMRAAAEHLTPVTLELGGKSPAIVAADADVEVTARRLAFGKFVNAGQTCIAPDYVLVEHALRDRLVEAIGEAVEEFYGQSPLASDDYGRIVNRDHVDRLAGLLAGEGSGTAVVGGSVDRNQKFIAPTVLIDTDPDASIMQEEIFGPILPVIAVDSIDQALDFVNARPKPLALYIFSESETVIDHAVSNTSSGGVGVNSTVLHIGPPELPFGGIGGSGMGAYHGRTGFETFSHLKSVYDKKVHPDLKVLYPPYTKMKERLIKIVQ